MRRNNRGFSYIELILVMAIMAIMLAIVALSIGMVTRSNINRSADKIESTLNQARATSMAKGSRNGRFTIMCDNGKYYYYVGDNTNAAQMYKDRVELASATINIGYTAGTSDVVIPLNNNTMLTLEYNQSTGAFNVSPTTSNYINSFVLTKDDRLCEIKLYPATGKCAINPEVIVEEESD